MNELTHFPIAFDDHRVAGAVRVKPDTPPGEALAALHLPNYQGVIVMHGGAGNTTPKLVDAIRQFLVDSLAPFAEKRCTLIVDGGTQIGAMAAMGDARHAIGGTYPLIGVCPHRLASYPGGPKAGSNRYPLDPSHSHFILVEGDQFGIESGLLSNMLKATGKPGLALIINGGDIAAREVLAHAEQGNPLVIVRGSGRFADELLVPGSQSRAILPPDTFLHIADLAAPHTLTAILEQLLG